MQRPHHAYPREHGRTAVLNQDQRLDRGLPLRCIVLALRQFSEVVGGVTQGDELATAGQGDEIIAFRAFFRDAARARPTSIPSTLMIPRLKNICRSGGEPRKMEIRNEKR
jgi:hypothetical protein